jgi:hypothetical protein
MCPSPAPPLAGAQSQPPAQNADMGFFDPAIMAMGTGKAFEYKPPMGGIPSNSPGETISPGLLSILKNLGGPPSANPPQVGEGFSAIGTGLPFFSNPPGRKDAPVRQQGFGGLTGPSFQPPPVAQGERYSQIVSSSGKETASVNVSKGEVPGGRLGSAGEGSRGSGVWGSGQLTAGQNVKEPNAQNKAQRGGLSSMMAAISGGNVQAPSFASAVVASQGGGRAPGAYSPALAGSGEVRGVNSPMLQAGQSSWAAIAAVKTPAGKQDPPEAWKQGTKETGKGGESNREGEGNKKEDGKGGGKVKEEKDRRVGGDVGEASDGGQEEGEEESEKVLNDEEEKVRLVHGPL